VFFGISLNQKKNFFRITAKDCSYATKLNEIALPVVLLRGLEIKIFFLTKRQILEGKSGTGA